MENKVYLPFVDLKPISELDEVTGLQPGWMLFNDGSESLQKISVDTFNNLSKTAKPLSPTDPSPTVEGLYKPTVTDTYTNAGNLEAKAGYITLFYFDGAAWTKSEDKIIFPTIPTFGVEITTPIDIVNKVDGNIKIAPRVSAYVLNLNNSTAALIDTNPVNVPNSINSKIGLSKSNSSYEPVNLTDNFNLIPKLYLYPLNTWNSSNVREGSIIGSVSEDNELIYPISDGVKFNTNKFTLPSANTDINNISEVFNKYVEFLDLYLESDTVTIQNMFLDSITIPYPDPTNAKIIFGSFINGVYTKVASARITESPSNATVIDWIIEPLNESKVNGYLKTGRTLFNYFFQAGNPNDWASVDGSDTFLKFNIENLRLQPPKTANLNLERENLGILPRIDFSSSSPDLNILKLIKEKNKDVTIIQLGDSISTNGTYTSGSSNAAYSPPRMDEECYVKLIESDLRWKGQQYRRYDAGSFFTETADTKESKLTDLAWDWQPPNNTSIFYNVPTRILSGNNSSVKFTIPSGNKNLGFIYRTDYLCANSTLVSISTGNGKVRVKNDAGNLVEANGFVFSAKEVDNIISTPMGDLRKSQAQKRLEFRFDVTTADVEITITNQGSGRLNYWGVEYTPYEYMFRYINVSRGGHDIQRIRYFEEWDVDAHKPDAVFLQCCIINEEAKSTPAPGSTNIPEAFANRFKNYIDDLSAKSYSPEVVPYVLYIGTQANIVNQVTGEYMSGVIAGEIVDIYKYIGALESTLSADYPFINMFNKFNEIAYRKAEVEETDNIYTSAILASGKTGNTFTFDSVHLNDYGSMIAYRLLKKYFNI